MVAHRILAGLLVGSILAPLPSEGADAAKPTHRPAPGWTEQLSDPRRLVPLILLGVIAAGLGRRFRQSWRAGRARERLVSEQVTLVDVENSVEHGREAVTELFQLLGTAQDAKIKDAAGHALSVLWARDELIPEEEKAIVRRGFQVNWRARRRYPRALRTEIPIRVEFGVPVLRADGKGVSAQHLRWSYRVEGARRVSLESWTEPEAGPGVAMFTVVPSDFATNGPHKLVLQTRVETVGLTDRWSLELPHMPFSFEFDPLLNVDALLALLDASRAETFASATRLVVLASERARFLSINSGFAIRGIPAVEVDGRLPCDLAHSVDVEFEGVDGWYHAGEVIVSGQGEGRSDPGRRVFKLSRFSSGGPSIQSPGPARVRVRLVPDAERGWADPEVRSIWPGAIETEWTEVEVVRL
jgi:hypothetical protein